MEKKRSIGVTIFAWLIIIVSGLLLLGSFDFKAHTKLFQSFPKNLNICLFAYGIASLAIGVIAGIGLIRLKEIMRKVIVGINLLDVLSGIPVLLFSLNDIKQYAYRAAAETNSQVSIDVLANIAFYIIICFAIFTIAFSMLIIYFFTRPKVKEQFK